MSIIIGIVLFIAGVAIADKANQKSDLLAVTALGLFMTIVGVALVASNFY
jgi:uncharacterized membrane protein HdeD (DUF308 family)